MPAAPLHPGKQHSRELVDSIPYVELARAMRATRNEILRSDTQGSSGHHRMLNAANRATI